jgi:hypothetical protein
MAEKTHTIDECESDPSQIAESRRSKGESNAAADATVTPASYVLISDAPKMADPNAMLGECNVETSLAHPIGASQPPTARTRPESIVPPPPQPIDIDAIDLRPLTERVTKLMAELERYEARRKVLPSGAAFSVCYLSADRAAVEVEKELRCLVPNGTDVIAAGGTCHRLAAIVGLDQALKLARDCGVWQSAEAPNLATLLAECRWLTGELKSTRANRRRGRPKNNEKDSSAKVIAALSAHHGYEGGSVTNYAPAKNRQLANDFELANNALTRFLKGKLGKRGYSKYVADCQKGSIGALLALWNGETQQRHATLYEEEEDKGTK